MLAQIKKRIEETLKEHLEYLKETFALETISPLLSDSISDFVLRPGKRIRPTFFILGYKAYSRSESPGLYVSSLAMELLHDFMLIHDDIIDKSDTRRGRPSMHVLLDRQLPKLRGVKFDGKDLAIVAGDVLYAMALHTFLAVKADPARKELGLKKFIEAALYTGSGEFIELTAGCRTIEEIRESDIYTIYDYKTAFYTFACPLSIGAILAGAPAGETKTLFSFGVNLGRAFQIQDDILGLFGNEKDIGKSTQTDLQEAKKTLLIRKAYENSGAADRHRIRQIMNKKKVGRSDLLFIKTAVSSSGSLVYARRQIEAYSDKALSLLPGLSVRPSLKSLLAEFSRQIVIPA